MKIPWGHHGRLMANRDFLIREAWVRQLVPGKAMRTNGKPLANVSHKAPTIGAVRCPSAALGPIAATICPDETGHRGDASASAAAAWKAACRAPRSARSPSRCALRAPRTRPTCVQAAAASEAAPWFARPFGQGICNDVRLLIKPIMCLEDP